MKKSKRKRGSAFGRPFWKLAAASPTFLQDLKLLEAAGIEIRLLRKSDVAYFNTYKRVIYVGKWSSNVNKIVSIGHEFVHALLRPTTHVQEGDDREVWINERLEEETEAIIHELLILQELIDAGKQKHFGKQFSNVGLGWLTIYLGGDAAAAVVESRFIAMDLGQPSQSILDTVRQGGREAVKVILCHTYTSTTYEFYPVYYAAWFKFEMNKLLSRKRKEQQLEQQKELEQDQQKAG